MGCIYLATNKVNGKRYVGKTVFLLSVRRSQHEGEACKHSRQLFHRALWKYGVNSFNWQIIAEDEDEDFLHKCEKFSIQMLRTKLPSGYNMTDGGEGFVGGVVTQETRRKMRKSHLGVPLSVKHKENIKNALTKSERHKEASRIANQRRTGYHHTTETKRKIGAASRKKTMSNEARTKISKALKGRKFSDKHKQRISESQKRSEKTKNHLEQLSQGWIGRKHTPETIRKMQITRLRKAIRKLEGQTECEDMHVH